MEEKILATMVTSFTKVLITESKELFDDIYDQVYDETKQFIGKDLKRYLIKQQGKYSHIKTLLRGNTPVYLYDIYFPLKLTCDDGTINTQSINTVFKNSNYVTIIGDAGSGKSTLVKHLFLNTIKEKYKIPILVELRYLNNMDVSLEEYIRSITSLNKISVNQEILNRYFEKGKFVFFLDGYDELEEETKKNVTKEINDFVNKYDSNSYLLTTRPYSSGEHFPLFHNYRMKDLSLKDGDIRGFIYKQLLTEKEVAEKIIKSIEQGNQTYIKSFLKNPLLLSLYVLTFQSYAEIPDKKYIFYRRVINALFSEHDSKTKLGFVREKQSGLNQEQFETILMSFSFISYFDNQFAFEKDYVTHKLKLIKGKHKELKFDNNKFIKDLKSAIAIWTDEDGELSFAHRSLQEYFTALLIKELTPSENKRVYDKIIARFALSEGRPMREVENLLKLLSEMDEYNYSKNFYLPILNELKESLNSNTQKELSISYVNFFTDGIGFRQEISRMEKSASGEKKRTKVLAPVPLVTEKVNKTIFVHFSKTKKLYDFIRNVYREEKISPEYSKACLSIKGTETENYRLRRFKNVLLFESCEDHDLFNKLDSKELDSLSKDYYDFILSELNTVNEFIKNKLEIEKDIVDFI
jgi:energy-coupling factor transporter ATP-binding protein EcfA2